MGKIFVVGIGPGSEEFLTPIARDAVKRADILIGGKNALALFPEKESKKIIDRNLDGILGFIRKNKQKNVAILTSGDPGFYSILDFLMRNFSKEEIEVIPGISSMQLCFSKIKDTWHDAEVISLHGRKKDNLLRMIENKKLVVLTDNSSPPDVIARYLLDSKVKGKRVVVCDSLATSNEKIVESTLEGIARQRFSGNSVMVIYDERGA